MWEITVFGLVPIELKTANFAYNLLGKGIIRSRIEGSYLIISGVPTEAECKEVVEKYENVKNRGFVVGYKEVI